MKTQRNRKKDDNCPKTCASSRSTTNSNKSVIINKHRILKEHGTIKLGEKPPTRNPYLNYFRKFYAQHGGKVSEAAKQAGANWRKMNENEKIPYINEANSAPFFYYTKVKRLNKIFHILQAYPNRKNSSSQEDKKIKSLENIQKILSRWTLDVYKNVTHHKSSNSADLSYIS